MRVLHAGDADLVFMLGPPRTRIPARRRFVGASRGICAAQRGYQNIVKAKYSTPAGKVEQGGKDDLQRLIRLKRSVA